MWSKFDRALDAAKLRQYELEEQLGLAENRISKWKNGQGNPTWGQLNQIATRLNISVSYLVDDSLDQPLDLASGLTDDEAFAIKLIRDLGLSRRDISRRLAGEAATEARHGSVDRGA